MNFSRNLKLANLLRGFNKIRWRYFLSRRNIDNVIVVIVVPGLEHLCVPSVRLLSPFFEVVVVSNGLSDEAIKWLHSALPSIPVFKFFTSIRGRYVLSHGDALDLLARAPSDMVFVDPDCYVFEPSLITQMFRGLERNAIVSLYSDPTTILGFRIPDTFCFGVQSSSLHFLRKAFSVRIGLTSRLSSSLFDHAVERWGNPVPFPHPGKAYFDTIHSLAIAANLANMGIQIIPSSEGQVFHVLGTSYRIGQLQYQNAEVDMTALNAHYFHCLLAEEFTMAVPSKEIACLINHYGGSRGILMKFSAYAQSEQRIVIDSLLSMLRDRRVLFVDQVPNHSVPASCG